MASGIRHFMQITHGNISREIYVYLSLGPEPECFINIVPTFFWGCWFIFYAVRKAGQYDSSLRSRVNPYFGRILLAQTTYVQSSSSSIVRAE